MIKLTAISLVLFTSVHIARADYKCSSVPQFDTYDDGLRGGFTRGISKTTIAPRTAQAPDLQTCIADTAPADWVSDVCHHVIPTYSGGVLINDPIDTVTLFVSYTDLSSHVTTTLHYAAACIFF